MTWHIIGILAFVVIYNIWRYYHEDEMLDNFFRAVWMLKLEIEKIKMQECER